MSVHENFLLNLAASSPEAAERGDKAAWLSLFTPTGWVQDPAGSRAFGGINSKKSLEDFFDVFIAAATLEYVGTNDYCLGNEVVRDGVFLIEIPGEHPLEIPVFLRYVFDPPSSIHSLQAFWALLPAVAAALKRGAPGRRYFRQLGIRLFRKCGVSGIGGFLKTLKLSATIGKATVFRLKSLLDQGRYHDASRLFSRFKHGEILINGSGIADTYPPGYLSMGEIRILEIDKLLTAGRFVCFRCTLDAHHDEKTAVGFCFMTGTGLKIIRAEFFI
ncbi:MAG: hypothetical protein HN368_08265 [Spirochaetales bacterium]|nr:hypothetical protein [Spirochaetales bacterium]